MLALAVLFLVAACGVAGYPPATDVEPHPAGLLETTETPVSGPPTVTETPKKGPKPDRPDPFQDPRMVAQQPLDYAKRSIQTLVRDDGYNDFTGIAFDNENHVVALYWKGPLPTPVSALVERLRAEVAIDVVDSPYSRQELVQEIKRIAAFDLVDVGVTIRYTASLRDFSGVKVAVASADQIPRAREAIKSSMKLEFSVSSGEFIPLVWTPEDDEE